MLLYILPHVTDLKSALDHVFMTYDIDKSISDFSVLKDALNTTDHLPVDFSLKFCVFYCFHIYLSVMLMCKRLFVNIIATWSVLMCVITTLEIC